MVPSRFVAQVVYKDNDSFIVAYMDPEDGRPEEFHEVPGNLEVLPNDPGVSIMPYVGHAESSRKERRRDSKAVARDVRQEYRRRREKLEELARNLVVDFCGRCAGAMSGSGNAHTCERLL